VSAEILTSGFILTFYIAAFSVLRLDKQWHRTAEVFFSLATILVLIRLVLSVWESADGFRAGIAFTVAVVALVVAIWFVQKVETGIREELKSQSGAEPQSQEGQVKPQPNIIMLGYPRYTFVTWDKYYVFHEDRVSQKSRRALVVDFRNELEQGKEIKSLGSVKSQLTYSYEQAPLVAHHINRGFWLDHEYTYTDFERGDTRTLLIGIIIPDPDGDDALMVYDDNKRESQSDPIRQPNTVTFQKYDPLKIKVALFTQTRHRFHKECELELGKDRRCHVTKPFG